MRDRKSVIRVKGGERRGLDMEGLGKGSGKWGNEIEREWWNIK